MQPYRYSHSYITFEAQARCFDYGSMRLDTTEQELSRVGLSEKDVERYARRNPDPNGTESGRTVFVGCEYDGRRGVAMVLDLAWERLSLARLGRRAPASEIDGVLGLAGSTRV